MAVDYFFLRDRGSFLGCGTCYLKTVLIRKQEHSMSDKTVDNMKLFELARTKRNREEPERRPKQIDNVIISYIQCW